ncbi:HXXXD-type acyl-transferase family protein [Citrus sinensis]|uniref:stemmadenine O-acetyltransferase-like n=1 Tax=Citrus sinensis TaxID=2711 RepID=UPI0003D7753B|nr:stemmadenine O-acetyltransferase-like [Citrus sinensis]KAH9746104.1 HXXXD-type acyl-transferase family protein [Citrus sinensis]
MAETVMKVDVIARETIKPSSPTPKALEDFKLCLMDQTAPAMFTALLFFYPAANDADHDTENKIAEKLRHLKSSLSKMLTQLYPLAGIIKDHITIECNDEGAEFVEARVSCRLCDILKQPDSVLLGNFLPVEIESTAAQSGRLLFVQANLFTCGGLAIGVCISHKIADAATLGTFINSWATAAAAADPHHHHHHHHHHHRPTHESPASPLFMASSLFPPLDTQIPTTRLIPDKYATKRYVFNTSNLAALKAKAASASVQQPTRVESVTALMWKCMINVTRSNKGLKELSLVSHSVDLRKRVVPPLPENTIGNIVGMFFSAQPVAAEEEIDLPGLVWALRKAKKEFDKNALEMINVEKRTWLKMCGVVDLFARRNDVDYCAYTSWCRFPLYEADFGWGKPVWVTLPHTMLKNVVYLLDTKDGEGIEALVSLTKEDMAEFERQEMLLQFADVNPSVLDEAHDESH